MPGDIIITEIMQNPSAVTDTNGEYFEVYNTTTAAIDMSGWTISDLDTNNHTISSSVIVPANGYAIIARNADILTNGGITVDYVASSSFVLANGDDEIILTSGMTIIDQVNYDGGPNFPSPDGASMELSITSLNSTDNDTGSNWGVAVTTFGDGDLGTPGVANDFTLLNNNFNTINFSVFPNPTSTGFVNIKTQSATDIYISVFDVLGKQVIKQKLSQERLNVSNLKSGVYIMKIAQNSKTTTKKLVIK